MYLEQRYRTRRLYSLDPKMGEEGKTRRFFLTWRALVLQTCNLHLFLFESQSLGLNPNPFIFICSWFDFTPCPECEPAAQGAAARRVVGAWEGEPFCPLHTGEFASLYAHHWTAKPTHASGHQFCPWFLLCTLVCVMCPSEPTVILVSRNNIERKRHVSKKGISQIQVAA